MQQLINQWSTVRGFLLLAAAIAGVPEPVSVAVLSAVDHLPQLAVATLGAVEVLRNGDKEPFIQRGEDGH